MKYFEASLFHVKFVTDLFFEFSVNDSVVILYFKKVFYFLYRKLLFYTLFILYFIVILYFSNEVALFRVRYLTMVLHFEDKEGLELMIKFETFCVPQG